MNYRNKYRYSDVMLREIANVSEVSDADNAVLVSQIRDIQRDGSDASKKAFIAHLKKRFGIKDKNTLSSGMKTFLIGSLSIGFVHNILKVIGGIYASVKGFSLNDGGIGVGSYIGTIGLIQAFVASLTIFVLYKVFKILDRTEVEESYNYKATQSRNLYLKKVMLESQLMISKVSKIRRYQEFIEGDSSGSKVGIVAKGWRVCKELFMKIVSSITGFVKKHPAISAAILICIGLVACYMCGNPDPSNPTVNDTTPAVDYSKKPGYEYGGQNTQGSVTGGTIPDGVNAAEYYKQMTAAKADVEKIRAQTADFSAKGSFAMNNDTNVF